MFFLFICLTKLAVFLYVVTQQMYFLICPSDLFDCGLLSILLQVPLNELAIAVQSGDSIRRPVYN